MADCTALADLRLCLRTKLEEVIFDAVPSSAMAYNSSFCCSEMNASISCNRFSFCIKTLRAIRVMSAVVHVFYVCVMEDAVYVQRDTIEFFIYHLDSIKVNILLCLLEMFDYEVGIIVKGNGS